MFDFFATHTAVLAEVRRSKLLLLCMHGHISALQAHSLDVADHRLLPLSSDFSTFRLDSFDSRH